MEQKPPPFYDCPECGSEVEFYETAPDGRSGRYRCTSNKCDRDTIWKELEPGKDILTFDQLMTRIQSTSFPKK